MHWQYDKNKITYFADTDFRGEKVRFGIRAEDRARHMYIIGKTGMGKSTLLENLAVQDIQSGEGMCFIDPHGGTAELLLKYVPKERVNDVIYFAPFDMEFPVAMNVLEKADMSKRPLIASGLLGAFKKVWPDSFSARMEYMLSNSLLALLETPGATLLGVNRMLADKTYRDSVIANVTDASVKAFWIDEFGKWTDKMVAEAVPAIQNKVGQFSANPLIRNILGQPESTFDIRWIMDNRKIFIVNLSKGRIGESNAALLGAMLVTKMYLAAMSRAELSASELKQSPPFYLYVDEFQSFANESFADILSEARKYNLCLTVAHQYIEQMTEEVRAAVFGNVGTMITFRVGSTDAEVLEKEFAPVFTVDDFVSLGFAQVYLKLMINGASSAPFSARTRDKPPVPEFVYEDEVIAASRSQFARPRLEVEASIAEWFKTNSNSSGGESAAPQTRKFAPGMRPERARSENSSPSQGGSRSFDRSQERSGERSVERRGDSVSQGASRVPLGGGLGLRDALAKIGSQAPQSAQQPLGQQYDGVQSQGMHQVGYQPGTPPFQQPPQYPQQWPQHPYPYGMPPPPYGYYPQPGQYHGYPYVLPPQMAPQYQYPQHPEAHQQMPYQYPPAPPYGYHPQHPGYAQGNPEPTKQEISHVPPQARVARSSKDDDVKKRLGSQERDNKEVHRERSGSDRPLVQSQEERQKTMNEETGRGKREDGVAPTLHQQKGGTLEPKRNLARKDDNKGPSKERLDTLAEALNKLKEKHAFRPHDVSIQKSTEGDNQQETKEVPLDVLKDVLRDDPS